MACEKKTVLGILGGIFNPVHNGHLAIAQLAREYYDLDRVLFVPAGIPPHKPESTIVSADHRMAMLRRALKDNKAFAIEDIEITQRTVSYTVNTLRVLQKRFAGSALYFIIGSDNLFEILTWRNYKTILRMVTFCVAHRPGFSLRIPPELSRAKILPFPSPEWGISSTKIRSYSAKKLSCRYLIPKGVTDYIRKNKLYQK